MQLSSHGRALLDSPDVVLADIRDEPALREIFSDRRPEVVFHAAALKHLPLLERYPGEAVKTNVWAPPTCWTPPPRSASSSFVNISTDKAANPTSVLGYSKRIAERLTARRGPAGRRHVPQRPVRQRPGQPGLGAHRVRRADRGGGPVTVTDPDVTRYFMTVQEAVQLVIQAGAIGQRR